MHTKVDLGVSEKNEMKKVDAFKEHSGVLQRHVENMSLYLHKEVNGIEAKIE